MHEKSYTHMLLISTGERTLQNIESNLSNLHSKVHLMLETTMQFRAEVNNSVNSLRKDLNAMNDSVSNLSMCLQEHKKQTETELADLQTSFVSTQANYTRLLNIKMDSLEECLSEHKEQLAGKLIALQTSQANHTSQLEKIQEDVTYIRDLYYCGGTGGWRRVVYLDMTNSNTTCPSGWQLTGYSKRTCGRVSASNTCDSTTFPVTGGEYSRICGKITAYQYASTDAFESYNIGRQVTIDTAYVDGVSVTHGTPRNHIWTFAAGITESNPMSPGVCPCDARIVIRVPLFVGDDYFCESGINEPWRGSRHYFLHSNDTLWDGEGCLPSSTCCSRRNPPYFVKQLPTSTTNDIEARICLDQSLSQENIAVELVELYVQ